MYVSISLSALFILSRQYTASNQKHQGCSFSYLQLQTCKLGSAFPHPACLENHIRCGREVESLTATPDPNHCHLREELAHLRRQRTAHSPAWLEHSKKGHIPWSSPGEKISYRIQSLSSAYGVWPRNAPQSTSSTSTSDRKHCEQMWHTCPQERLQYGEPHWTAAR